MSNPTASDVHVNTPLTNFGQRYIQSADSFIAMRAMPNLPVSHQSDLYYEFNRGDMLRDEAEERADNAESAGSGFRLSTSSYFAKVYAFHKDVTDRQRANADSQINLDNSATIWVASKMMIKRETLFNGIYMGAGKWTTEITPAAGDKWDASTSDPVVQVRVGKRTVQGLTGYKPNKMIVARDAYDALLDNDAILSRITGGATTDIPAQVLKTLLTQLFELDEILIQDAVINTAPADISDPTADTIAFLSTAQALLYYAPNSLTLDEPTAGAQFSWTGYLGATPSGFRASKFRMPPSVKTDRIEGEMAFDQKITGPDLGYMFLAVLT